MPNASRAVHAALLCLVTALVTATGALALEKKPLTIISATGRHDITVEVAASREEQMTGLMFRRSLGPSEGMIFIYPQDQEITMWMKNTYISLDMIFLKRDGTVLRVERNTEPLSERVISSGDIAGAVVEMIAGSAERLAVKRGDKIEFAGLK
jgi:uncharacterized protein